MKAVTHLLCLLLGAVIAYFIFSPGKVSVKEFNALEANYTRSVAQGMGLRAERDEWKEKAEASGATADSFRSLRVTARKAALDAPDSAAKSLGLTVTKPESTTRCLPVGEFAELVAAKIELGLADSAALLDSVALNACGEALIYSDSAEVVARRSAEASFKAAKSLAAEVQVMRRTKWLYAVGGATVALLAAFGLSAL